MPRAKLMLLLVPGQVPLRLQRGSFLGRASLWVASTLLAVPFCFATPEPCAGVLTESRRAGLRLRRPALSWDNSQAMLFCVAGLASAVSICRISSARPLSTLMCG
ncbi:hypothetical protein D3C80_1795570 [compost metagenome]